MSFKGIRLRYSLRGLLVLFTLVAIWLGYWANAASNQKAATASIREMGGSVLYHYQVVNGMTTNGVPRGPDWLRKLLGRDWFDTVIFVEFYNKPCTGSDEQLASALSKLPRVNVVHLSLVKTGATTTKTLGKMTRLEALSLSGPTITDDSLQDIYPLRKLRQLNLKQTKVTDAGIKGIQAATPGIYISNQREPDSKGGMFE